MKITSAKLLPYKFPFSKPFHSATGTVLEREGIILRLESDDGYVGYGDAASWPGFGSNLTAVRQAMSNVIVAGQALESHVFRSPRDITAWLAQWPSLPPEVAHAVDLAVLDMLAQRVRKSIAELLNPEPREVVSVHVLATDAVSAKEAVKQGARAIKIKVGGHALGDDMTRVAAIRSAVGRDVEMRLDANGAWTRDEAERALKALTGLGIAWIEEPLKRQGNENFLPELAELRVIAKQVGVGIALDESVQTLKDLEAAIEAKAADVVIIKPMFAGGLVAGLELYRRAREAGLQALVTHALESAVGRVGAMHLAAAIDGPLAACGLANPLADDIALTPSAGGGWIEVPSMPGLGINVTPWANKELGVATAEGAKARR